jgi:hypothetical protein
MGTDDRFENLIMTPRMRLVAFRNRAGLDPAVLAAAIGISKESYYDLEQYDTELLSCVTLRELAVLSRMLGVSPRELFSDSACQGNPQSLETLSGAVASALRDRGLVEFENSVGWGLSNFLEDPKAAMEWNVVCLRDVCSAVGFDWLAVLQGVGT